MSKVLLIDDNFELLEMLEFVLKMHGHAVGRAGSKPEALVNLTTFEPDFVMIDVRLGNEDGRELCKYIKSVAPNVIVFLISGSPEMLEDYKECEADDIIEKPFSIETILSKINKYR